MKLRDGEMIVVAITHSDQYRFSAAAAAKLTTPRTEFVAKRCEIVISK